MKMSFGFPVSADLHQLPRQIGQRFRPLIGIEFTFQGSTKQRDRRMGTNQIRSRATVNVKSMSPSRVGVTGACELLISVVLICRVRFILSSLLAHQQKFGRSRSITHSTYPSKYYENPTPGKRY